MSKLIYAVDIAAFKKAYPNYALATDPSYRAVAYTGDGYIITHGKSMKANVTDDGSNPYGLDFTRNGQTLSVSVAGSTKSVTLPVINIASGTTDVLTLTNSAGTFTLSHALGAAGWTANQSIGPTADGSATIKVPAFTYDKYGHIKNATAYTARLDYVYRETNTDSNVKYLTFATTNTSTRSSLQTTANIKAVASTGALYAKQLYENEKALNTIYAPISHASSATTYGASTDSNYGHVRLSDSITSTSGTTGGYAATPKAVKDALDSSKSYADGLFASNDAMIFIGTINASSGVIMTVNSVIASKYAITAGTTKLADLTTYQAGWTFRVSTAGTITNVGVCEIGDMIICVSDRGSAYAAADWSVIQTNLDGAVTAANTLTTNTVILGNGSKAVKALANGSNGTVLKIVSGVPTWSTDNTTRAIQVHGTQLLAANSSTPLNITSSGYITLSTDSATGKIIIGTKNISDFDIKGLTFQNAGTDVLTYNPANAAMKLNALGGIKITNVSDVSDVITLSHTNSITSQTSSAVRSFAYDSNGHITASSVVTSLKNPTAFTYGVGTTTDSYDGSAAKTLKFAGSGDTSVAMANGTITISSANHTAYIRAGSSTGTVNAATTNGNTYLNLVENGSRRSGVKLAGTGATTVVSDASGNVTINSVNSWRNITAFKKSTSTVTEVLSTTLGGADLDFGKEFIWDDSSTAGGGRLHLCWAEVDASGNITYEI